MEFAQPPPDMNFSMPPPNMQQQQIQHPSPQGGRNMNNMMGPPQQRPFFRPQGPGGFHRSMGGMPLSQDDFDGKRLRKSVMRKTVDYNASIVNAIEVCFIIYINGLLEFNLILFWFSLSRVEFGSEISGIEGPFNQKGSTSRKCSRHPATRTTRAMQSPQSLSRQPPTR